MKIFASINDKLWTFDQSEKNGTSVLRDKSQKLQYEFIDLGHNRYNLLINDTSHLVHIIKENSVYHVHLDGDYFPVRVEDERTRQLRELVEHSSQTGGGQTVLAPIPGFISKIRVSEGDTITHGDGLIILEAMKMENEIKAGQSGKIKKILIKEGTPVDKDQELLIIE
jgi:biotin carboxyl carrier protein